MPRKSLSVAQRLLDESHLHRPAFVTPMRLLKLVYVAHGLMLGSHGRGLLDEAVEAWPHGPIVPSVYDAVRGYRSSAVLFVPGAAPLVELDRDEITMIRRAVDTCAPATTLQIASAMIQPGTPWAFTRDNISARNDAVGARGPSISNDLIEHFYRAAPSRGRQSKP